MSSLGINFSGLASGLDTRAIIDALVAVESRPIAGMENRQKELRKAKSLFGELAGLLDKLRSAANGVRLNGSFLDYKVAVDDDTRVGATISSGARAGAWDVKVNKLAQAKVTTSDGKADKNTTGYGTGSLLLTVGNQTREIAITGANNTLEGIAAAINDAGLDVSAQVLDTGGTGSDRYKLMISGTKTGAANAFDLQFDDGSATLAALVDETRAARNLVTAAQDAELTVNGALVRRATNQVGDAIPGVILDLKGLHDLANPSTRVTVTADTTKTAEKVKAFVDAYNAVVDFVDRQNETDEDGKAKNPLFGDSTLRSMRSTLRGIVGSSVATGNEAYALFAQVGITSDRDGRLTLDQSTLKNAIADDEDAVARLFADTTGGIASRVYSQINAYTGAVDGLFKARNDGFDRQIRDLERRIELSERRLDAYEAQLVKKFAAMETLVGRLQGQGNSLSAISSRTAQNRK